MANEWQIVELLGDKGNPVRYTIANGTAIPKGTVMVHADDDKLIEKHSSLGEPFAGIAAHEKVANDGSTTMTVYTCGIFLFNDGAEEPAVGTRLRLGGTPNTARSADATALLKSMPGVCINYGTPSSLTFLALIGSGL